MLFSGQIKELTLSIDCVVSPHERVNLQNRLVWKRQKQGYKHK